MGSPCGSLTASVCRGPAGALRVVAYEGQSRGAGKSRVVTAAELASADIVVTTYDSLAHDIYHVPLSEVHSYPLRHGKKYEVSDREAILHVRIWQL